MPRLGLALSGGGYRAAAFHLGTLRALNNMKILSKVDVLSTVSGGSIVGADYALSGDVDDYPEFEKQFILKLKQSVISRVLSSVTFVRIVLVALIWLGGIVGSQFTLYPWAGWIILILGLFFFIRYQFSIFPVSKIIEGIYDRIFFNTSKLGDLPERPLMAINSTNLETGRQFTFSKDRMGDSTYDGVKFKSALFPVSRAVMASSCVPFAFTPVPVDKEFFASANDTDRAHPMLIDGGVYDNQGMHKLTFDTSGYRCAYVITSDAGNKMPFEGSYGNVFTLLIRTMDLFMNRIKKFQMMDNMYQPGRSKEREIAYISLGWDLDRCIPGFVDNLLNNNIQERIIQAHRIPKEFLDPFDAPKIEEYLEKQTGYAEIRSRQQTPRQLAIARSVGTNLTGLSDEQINALINQSELMTELQVRLYCTMIL